MTAGRSAAIAGVLLAGVALGRVVPMHRIADASAYVMIADSLWRDGDLRYQPKDYGRARALGFEDHPGGLFLVEDADGTLRYGKPPVYAILAAPFYAVLGLRGFYVLNGLLLGVLVLACAAIVRDVAPGFAGLAIATGAVFGSVTPVYVLWIDPFLLASVAVAAAVLAWRRERAFACGLSLALLASIRAPYLALAVAPVSIALAERRWAPIARLAAGLAVGALLVIGLTWSAGADVLPHLHGLRRVYPLEPPFAHGPADRGHGEVVDRWPALDPVNWPGPSELVRSNAYFWLGRFAGILPYFPAFFACLLWMERMRWERLAWTAGAALVGVVLQVLLPHAFAGGAHALGNRYFVFLPAALVAVERVRVTRARVVASLALLALVLPVVAAPVELSRYAGRQMAWAPYRWLPLEWSQVDAMDLPAIYTNGFGALTLAQHDWEAPEQAVWTVGGRRSEFVLVRSQARAPVVQLRSRLPSATIVDGGERREVALRLDADTEVELRNPVVRWFDPGRLGFHDVAIYRLTIETREGFRPIDHGIGTDSRSLGVLVRPVP